MSLSLQEKALVERIAMLGPVALTDDGYDVVAARDFMERPAVKAEMERLNLEFKHQAVLGALVKFGARRQLARLAPGSIAVLGAGLAGPVYARNEDGTLQRDMRGNVVVDRPEPTNTQMKAATEILDRVGVESAQRVGERLPSVNLNVMFKESAKVEVEVVLDPDLKTHEQQALSREKIRTGIDTLRSQLSAIRESDEGQKLLDAVGVVVKPRKKRRIVRKKTSAKKKVAGDNGVKKKKGVRKKVVRKKLTKKKKVVRKAAKKGKQSVTA